MGNFDGFLIETNSNWTLQLGWDADELHSIPLIEFIHPDDRYKTVRAAKLALLGKEPKNFINRFKAKNGEYHWLQWTSGVDKKQKLTFNIARDITALVEKDRFLKTTTELAKIGGWKYDLQQGKHQWTPETYRIFDLPVDSEVSLDRIVDYYSPKHQTILRKLIKQCLNGESFITNLQIQTAKNNTKWIRLIANPVTVKGKVIGVQGTIQDVDRELTTKIKLIEGEERYKIALDASNDGIWDWDFRTNEVFYSDHLVKVLGYEKSDFSNDKFIKSLYPGDYKKMMRAISHYLDTKEPYDIVLRVANVNGEYLWFRSKGKAIFDDNGKPYRMSGSLTNITDLKNKEQALHKAYKVAETYQTAINMVAMVCKTDALGNITYINDKFCEISGYSASELFGKNVADVFHEDFNQDFKKSLLKTLSNGEIWEGTLKQITKTGENYWTDTYIVPLFYGKEETKEYMYIAYDKTKELSILDELEQEKLKTMQASKLAAIGEMAGGIAHEINNPLAIIHGYATHLRKSFDSQSLIEPDKQKELADKIVSTTERIAKIVKGLKAFSRESSSTDFELVSVQEIVRDTLSFCLERFRAGNVTIDTYFPSEEIFIQCRRVEISQVLLNLLNNAYDATKDAGADQIDVQVLKNKNLTQICVIDYGTGIDKEIKDKILNPFFTTKEVGKGTGLGLSISRRILENHKGELKFHSNGKTVFIIQLPVAAATSREAA